MDIKLGRLPGKIAGQDRSVVFVKLDGFFIKVQCSAEAYIEPSRISAMKLFFAKVHNFRPLAFFAEKLHHRQDSAN